MDWRNVGQAGNIAARSIKHLNMDEFDFKQLADRVASLINENRYGFSDEDMSLLKEIEAELETQSNNTSASGQQKMFDLISMVIKFLRLFEIEDFTGLF